MITILAGAVTGARVGGTRGLAVETVSTFAYVADHLGAPCALLAQKVGASCHSESTGLRQDEGVEYEDKEQRALTLHGILFPDVSISLTKYFEYFLSI